MAAQEEELPQPGVGFMGAVGRRDVPGLELMFGDGFVLTTGRPGAAVRPRREWLDLTRDRYCIEFFRFEWMRVEAQGDAVVVRSRHHQRERMGGLDRSGAYPMTDVWVRHAWDGEGRGGLVARHSSALGTA